MLTEGMKFPVTSDARGPRIEMGKKYQTRDGRAVRILSIDLKGCGCLTVIGLITGYKGEDIIETWTEDGRVVSVPGTSNRDLIPVPTKHEVWAWVSDDGRVLGFCDRNKTMMQATCEPNEHVKLVTWED